MQFLFKSTHHSCRYERKCEWVFFSEYSVHLVGYNSVADNTDLSSIV